MGNTRCPRGWGLGERRWQSSGALRGRAANGIALGWAFVSLVLAACETNDTPQPDADRDASAGHAPRLDAGADAARPQPHAADGGAKELCPIAVARRDGVCKTSANFELKTVAKAAYYGVGAELVAGGGALLVVRGGDAPSRVVELNGPGDNTFPTQIAMPAGLAAVDVLDYGETAHVLACKASGCEVLERPWNEYTFKRVANSNLPAEFEARALVRGPSHGAYTPMFCALGRGIRCFDGEGWQQDLSSGPIISAVIGAPSVAITQARQVLVRRGYGESWAREPLLEGDAVRWVDVTGRGAEMLVDADTWAWVDADGHVEPCSLGAEFDVLRVQQQDNRMLGHLRGGGLVHFVAATSFEAWCDEQPTDLDTVLDLTTVMCAIGVNPRVLTASEVLGSNFCPLE